MRGGNPRPAEDQNAFTDILFNGFGFAFRQFSSPLFLIRLK